MTDLAHLALPAGDEGPDEVEDPDDAPPPKVDEAELDAETAEISRVRSGRPRGTASLRTKGARTAGIDRARDKTGCRRRADLTRLALTAGLV